MTNVVSVQDVSDVDSVVVDRSDIVVLSDQNGVSVSVTAPDTHVVSVENDEYVSVEVQVSHVVAAGAQGPQGVQGPIGPSGGNAITRLAGAILSGHRVLKSVDDVYADYADATNLNDIGRVLGISINSAAFGGSVDIIRVGSVTFNGWSFNESLPVYLSTTGLLTQTPPLTGFSQIVGFAESPTTLFVDLREPIVLN